MPTDGEREREQEQEREWVRLVQRRALERALVDDVDARRYFALAGSLDRCRGASTVSDAGPATDEQCVAPSPDTDTGGGVEGVLSAAMVSLAVVPFLGDDGARERPHPFPSTPASPSTTDPWAPGDTPTRPAVRHGARLALRWFDVPPERVAARAGLPEATLTTPGE